MSWYTGIPCTRHRVFLAALIVAAKYLNDSSPKNKHWANYAGIFERDEINLMEKQLVFLLDFNLRFSEDEAILYFRPFMRGGALHLSAPFMSKENIRKLAARPIRPCATPILAPKPPVTPPAEEVLPFSTRQQQRRPQVDALPQCQTVFGPTPAPVRPPRPAPLYQIDSSDSSVSLVELTEDNGTSSSSAESSSEGEVMRVAPARFVLRPVPLDRRRKASGSAIHTSASAGAIPPTQLLNVVGRGQRIVSLNTKTEEATLPSATSVPSFLGRMFGKQQLREPRIHIASNELLPDRCREPVSREILYDADLA
ncbi:hypothetical protein BKA62DRAFT_689229 [Auriculariales sp. MPI-PUGE-AT-0066]|nr:hypothetical protein BKA62DRAFT_689229 [Auriculariales sp. MPI-PUGE-AT-0066]